MLRARVLGVVFWAILALLIVGLAGFGIGTSGIGTQNVARVGDREISRTAYLRALDQEVRAISAQLGRPLTGDEMRQFGVDRIVLARLVGDAALDAEAETLGLSAGDDVVREQLLATQAFLGIDGEFDRDAYIFALDRVGLTPREFEEMIRRETTRELVASSLQAPAAMPATAALSIMEFLGERRSFEWIRLDAEAVGEDRPSPTDEQLRAFYEANPERYTRPETREITYASLTPDALMPSIEIPEDAVRAAYGAQADRFNTPERRVVDRIVFGTVEEAQGARERLNAQDTDFDALAAERGLAPEDIDQGFVTEAGLDPALREALFGADQPGVVGPVTSPLGPALYRINAIVAASTVPFEAARDDLEGEAALEDARARIQAARGAIDDLVAGGATVEEIAAETDMQVGTLALSSESEGELADDPAFREAALAAATGVETDPIALGDGGIAILRVDSVTPPTVIAFDEVRDRVQPDWIAEATAERLIALGEGYAEQLAGGQSLGDLAAELGSEVESAGPITRGETVPDAPAPLVAEIFAADPAGSVVLPDGAGAILAQVSAVEPFDPDEAESAAVLEGLEAQLAAQNADDLLGLYIGALQARSRVSLNEDMLADALQTHP